MKKKIETLKALFKAMKAKTSIDHSEWVQADNLDEIRVFAPTDYVSGEEDELQVENEHGSVFGLEELSEDEIDVLIFSLSETEEPKFMCSNCGGGFNRADMVIDEDNENDLCTDCAKPKLDIPQELVVDMAITLNLFCDMYNCNDEVLAKHGIDWWYMHKLNRRVQALLNKK